MTETGIERIAKIIADRDKISIEEATELVEKCREECMNAISIGNISEPEEIIRNDLGLEPDYLEDFLF